MRAEGAAHFSLGQRPKNPFQNTAPALKARLTLPTETRSIPRASFVKLYAVLLQWKNRAFSANRVSAEAAWGVAPG
jgi:hypothetical protein